MLPRKTKGSKALTTPRTYPWDYPINNPISFRENIHKYTAISIYVVGLKATRQD